MRIKVDFHVHTSYSADGISSPEQIISHAKKRGIDALAICDHNQWFTKERLEKTQKNGVLLLPGCEFSTNSGHLLCIFFDYDTPFETIAPPGRGRADFDRVCDRVHELGGICILAHPFQGGNCPALDFGKIDAVEIFNARSAFKYKKANEDAQNLAKLHNIPGISVSDAHSRWETGNGHTLLEVSEISGEAIRQGIKTPGIGYYTKNTPAVFKGLSQWRQKIRQKRYRELPKAFLYLFYCITKDIFRY